MSDDASVAIILALQQQFGRRQAREALLNGAVATESVTERYLQDRYPISPSIHQWATTKIEEGYASGISVISFLSSDYPTCLHNCPDPPLVLFYKGAEVQNVQMVALVGSRNADISAWRFTAKVASDLAQAGAVVVSGLARGVDSAAHGGALDAGRPGSTIAVVAHGLDMVYPASNRKLADQILQNGGTLISEYPVGTPPLKHHFLERNRIIAALCHSTIVVQAGERSGALVTAREALEAGRDLFVVPGPADDLRYAGSHYLLKNGAYLATSAQDVLDLLPIEGRLPTKPRFDEDPISSSANELSLQNLFVTNQQIKLEHLPEKLGISAQEVFLLIADLESRGLIEQSPDGKLTYHPKKSPRVDLNDLII